MENVNNGSTTRNDKQNTKLYELKTNKTGIKMHFK